MFALLVIDMLNDFVKPDGALPVPGAEDIVENINKLIKDFQGNDDLVVFVNDAHEVDDPEFMTFPLLCVKGTPGAHIYPKIIGNRNIIEKTTYSAFAETNLDDYLIENQVECIFLCGVATDICLKAAAEGALVRNYHVTIIEDASRGLTKQAHVSALEDMLRLGVDIKMTRDILCVSE